jgi:hypothetical protein
MVARASMLVGKEYFEENKFAPKGSLPVTCSIY